MVILIVALVLFFFTPISIVSSPSVNPSTEFQSSSEPKYLPVVINTWSGPFTAATEKAWQVLVGNDSGDPLLDALEAGCSECEAKQCDGSVGFGGSPNEEGETTLDAMIMDGRTHDVGAVGCLKNIKSAISVARKVMEHTTHTLLVGDDATKFAVEMGFSLQNLSTPRSEEIWKKWKANKCQPNFWVNVIPDPKQSCGPYHLPDKKVQVKESTGSDAISKWNHDTIGMAVIDTKGDIAVGTSTNGLTYKIAGRVGDSPIAGSGAYVDNDVGAAAATGDGDIMMRFLPTYQTVENMRHGMSPSDAANDAVRRIRRVYPDFKGGIVAVNKKGQFGGACNGWTFTYSVRNPSMNQVEVYTCQG